MKKIIVSIIMAVIMTATAVALNIDATKDYNAAQAATVSYPNRYNGIARVYSRDLNEFKWSNYMDLVEWLDPDWKGSSDGNNEVTIKWWTGKAVCHPAKGPEPVLNIVVELANGKSGRTYRPVSEIFK